VGNIDDNASDSVLNNEGEIATAGILVIEDNIEDLRLLTEILTRAGHRVRPIRTGKAGLRAARLLPPDLILLDIRLPDADGYSICRTLKENSRLSDIPVIFISGLIDAKSQVKGFEAGGRDYITKPFEEVVVTARVHNQLEIQRLERQQRLHAQVQERHRIARELHDSVNQTLFILGAKAQVLILSEPDLATPFVEKLRELHQLSQTAIDEIRMLLFELYPEAFRSTPLVNLLSRFARALSTQTQAEFSVRINDDDGEIEQNYERKIALYRIAQEAMLNAVKYANARCIDIQIMCSNQTSYLSITDDGIGFDISAVQSSGMGLINLRERALQAKLKLSVVSAIGHGTKITATW
jgi:two-component system, sensor histidine kinase and response regulator